MTSFLKKILLILIAVGLGGGFSFCPISEEWKKQTDAIRVGNNHVRADILLDEARRKLRQVNSLTRQHLSMPQFLATGVLPQIIQEKVSGFLTLFLLDDLDLIASNEAIGNYLVNNPNFQTNTGAYDARIVQAFYRQKQMSETEFLSALKQELAKKHLTDAMKAIVVEPELLQNKLYSYMAEKRNVSALLVPSSAVEVKEKPTVDELKEYYQALEESLYEPEYRQVRVLRLELEKVMASIPVEDKEIKENYQENLALYSQSEKRRVEQILVKEKALADEILKDLTADNFVSVAKEKAGQEKEDTDLGWVDKDNIREELYEVLSSLPVNQVSSVVETDLGYHILIVKEIQKAQQTTLEQVKEEIKKTLQAKKALDAIYEKQKKLDALLGEGKSLSESAESVGLAVEDPVWIDVSGIKRETTENQDIPADILQKVFMSKVGYVSLIEPHKDGYIVVELADIKDSSLKPFENVKKELTDEWLKDKQKENLENFAKKVFEEAQNKGLQFVADKYHLEIKDLQDMTRASVDPTSQKIASQLFALKENQMTLLDIDEDNYAIAQVDKITPADESDEISKQMLLQNLETQTATILFNEALNYYAQREGVVVNQDLIEQTFSPLMKED